jgi:DUF971 family protein
MIYPVALHKTSERTLQITWSDNEIQSIPFRRLREACPCATCREKKMPSGDATENVDRLTMGMLPVISAAEARPLDILAMEPVGNYAYNIRFSDGHSSGLFTFEWLRNLEN